MSPLLYLLGWPVLAALGLLFVPRSYRFAARIIAIVATFFSLLVAVKIFWSFTAGSADLQFVLDLNWIPALGIRLHLAVDGLNVGLVLMAAVVAFAAACAGWEVKEREKEFYLLFLVMTAGIFGAFVSFDLFFFYFFHELALVPTFIMIGIWGRGPRKNYAAFQITIYLTVGALLALVGLIALYVQTGANTFDLLEMIARTQRSPVPVPAQNIIFPLLLFGFGILVSLWPFHSWAPLGYASAPTPTAMLHAGVLKKFGLYGLLRIALPVLPDAAREWMPILACLCLGNLLYCGLVAMRQRDLNLLIGNSSVAHMGFIFLGIASLNVLGFTGAVMVMIAHGFLAAFSFGLSGYLYQQTRTLDMPSLGGLLRELPFVGTCLIFALFAACGLPGFANFVGESMVLFGAWKVYPAVTAVACWGALVVGAVYSLRAVRVILHGPLPAQGLRAEDAQHFWRKLPFLLLLGNLLVFGCWPRLLVERIEPSAQAVAVRWEHPGPAPALAGPRPEEPGRAPATAAVSVRERGVIPAAIP